jgi:hypothetical protein
VHQALGAVFLGADKFGAGAAGLGLGVAGNVQARGVFRDLGTDLAFKTRDPVPPGPRADAGLSPACPPWSTWPPCATRSPRLGGDPEKINPLVQPVDLVIDHSVMVDEFGTPARSSRTSTSSTSATCERYQFLRWGQKAFDNFRVVPPGTGICHQVNLEYLGQGGLDRRRRRRRDGRLSPTRWSAPTATPR